MLQLVSILELRLETLYQAQWHGFRDFTPLSTRTNIFHRN